MLTGIISSCMTCSQGGAWGAQSHPCNLPQVPAGALLPASVPVTAKPWAAPFPAPAPSSGSPCWPQPPCKHTLPVPHTGPCSPAPLPVSDRGRFPHPPLALPAALGARAEPPRGSGQQREQGLVSVPACAWWALTVLRGSLARLGPVRVGRGWRGASLNRGQVLVQAGSGSSCRGQGGRRGPAGPQGSRCCKVC